MDNHVREVDFTDQNVVFIGRRRSSNRHIFGLPTWSVHWFDNIPHLIHNHAQSACQLFSQSHWWRSGGSRGLRALLKQRSDSQELSVNLILYRARLMYCQVSGPTFRFKPMKCLSL